MKSTDFLGSNLKRPACVCGTWRVLSEEKGSDTREWVPDLSQLSSMCSKCQIKSAVPRVALKLVVGESSGNTRSERKDSSPVA